MVAHYWSRYQINAGLLLELYPGVFDAANQIILVYIPEWMHILSGLLKIQYFKDILNYISEIIDHCRYIL